MGRVVGIDLGTTNSAVAVYDKGDFRILHNSENEQLTPSIVTVRKGEFLVGRAAWNYWEFNPENTIVSIKRLIGRAISDPEVKRVQKTFLYKVVKPSDGTEDSIRVLIEGKEYSPVEISAKILEKLKKDAEAVLGEEITHAVITVPAYFSDKQRYATREAGIKAGLKVMRLLDEPTAAAIAFGVDALDSKEVKTVLVYDLGGGTFDVSVLVMSAGTFAPLNLEGDMWLGGDNFDQAIVDYILSLIKEKYGIDLTDKSQLDKEQLKFIVKLKKEARKAKETLSTSRKAEIIIPDALKDEEGNVIDIDEEITREQFEELVKPLVNRTVEIVKKAVENAKLTLEDIDYVVMAGNASSIPLIQKTMEDLFGKEKIVRKAHPKYSVAIGAAIVAARYNMVQCPKCRYDNPLESEICEKCGTPLEMKEELRRSPVIEDINRIAPFHYGVQTVGDKFNIFIRKGDPFPTPEDKILIQTFYTRFYSQRIASCPIYGGEVEEYASKNTKQGEVFIFLPPNCPQGTPIKVKMWLNEDGYFVLDAFMEDGRDLREIIVRGEIDQKVIEALLECQNFIEQIKNRLNPIEREKIEKNFNSLLEEIEAEIQKDPQKRDYKILDQKINMFKNDLEKLNVDKEVDEIFKEAKVLKEFAVFILGNYYWCMPKSSLEYINQLISEIDQAIKDKNEKVIKMKIEELKTEIDRQCKNSLLGILLTLRIIILEKIRPKKPIEADRFFREFCEIEKDLKSGNYDYADIRLKNLIEEIDIVLKEIGVDEKIESGKIACWKCGCENELNKRYCKKCGADLWIMG